MKQYPVLTQAHCTSAEVQINNLTGIERALVTILESRGVPASDICIHSALTELYLLS